MITRTLVEWPAIIASLRGRLRRVDEITDAELVTWLLARRPWLDADDARFAVQVVLHDE